MQSFTGINMIECDNVRCYVLRGISGDVLIDTGLKKYRDEIETWLLNFNIKLIVLTSGRFFASENAAYFAKLYNAKIAMSEYDIPKNNDNPLLNYDNPYYVINKLAYSHNRKKRVSLQEREAFVPDILVSDGMRLCDLGVKDILSDAKIISLEGYTRGSIGIINSNDIYVGAAVGDSLYGFWCNVAESPKRAKLALEKIAALQCDRIFPLASKPLVKEENDYYKFIRKFSK